VENVAALLSRGMDVVLRDLSQIGYDCEWHIISASVVGAPHRRERVWIICNSNGNGKPAGPVNDETSILQEDAANSNRVNDAMRRNCQVDAAEMAGRDGNARGGQRDSRTGCTEGTGEGSCDVPNANGVGRDCGRDNRKKRYVQRDEKRNSSASLSDGEQSQLNSGKVRPVLPNANGERLEGKRSNDDSKGRQ